MQVVLAKQTWEPRIELWLICRLNASLGSTPGRVDGWFYLEQPCYTGPGDLANESPRAMNRKTPVTVRLHQVLLLASLWVTAALRRH